MKNRKVMIIVITLVALLVMSYGTAYSYTFKVPLSKISSAKQITLRCITSSYSLSIPVPERWKVEKAILNFSYVNSAALLSGKSKLVIKLKGNPIAQVNLNPLAPEGSVRLSLPVSSLEAGYNDLTFMVTQHYTTDCEFPCQPDLWTTLKLDEAEIELEYRLREVPLKLSSIANFLFDPKINPRGEVNIVVSDINAEAASVASLVASGVAGRFDYKKVAFSISKDIKSGYDNILIGNKDFVGNFLKQTNFDPEEIKGPYLKVMHLPQPGAASGRLADSTHAMIVVSGIKPGDLKLAAETFATMSISFPDTSGMTALGISMPDIPRYGGKLVLQADKKYTFKNMHFPTKTMRGISSESYDLSFRLPADFLIKQNLYAEVSLHYAYGAALRSDSALNIVLNGKFLRAIHLDDVKGGFVEGYKLEIPTYLFRAGDNTISFQPVLSPSQAKLCDYFQVENLFFTIIDTSTLKFPPMPHYVAMPKLELFMLNGFPVTRWPDGHGAKIYLTDLKTETVEAALNLVGTITKKNGYPLLELQMTSTMPEKYAGELIIVGDTHTIPDTIKKLTPLALTKETTVSYPVVQSWADDSRFAFSKQISGLSPGRGALMEFQSPYANGSSVVVLTAYSPKDVLDLSTALMESSVQSSIKGDLILIDLNNPEKDIVAMDVGKKYFAGETGFLSVMNSYLYTYPWLYYLMVGVVVIILSLIVFSLLHRYRKKGRTGA